MFGSVISWILRHWPQLVLKDDDGKPYLTRYYLLLHDFKSFGIYLHHFHTSDNTIDFHSHPWRVGVSLVLKHGYLEDSSTHASFPKVVHKVLLPGRLNVVRPDVHHRVTLLNETKGAWTLFFVGPRDREWTFLDVKTGEIKDRYHGTNAH